MTTPSAEAVLERLRNCVDGNWSCLDVGREEAAAVLAHIDALQRALSAAKKLLAEAQGLIDSCASFYNAQDQADASEWDRDYEAFVRELRAARGATP